YRRRYFGQVRYVLVLEGSQTRDVLMLELLLPSARLRGIWPSGSQLGFGKECLKYGRIGLERIFTKRFDVEIDRRFDVSQRLVISIALTYHDALQTKRI